MKSWRKRYATFLNSGAWSRIKAQAAKVNGSTCTTCGSSWHVQFHHTRYPKRFRAVRAEEVLPLCEDCHRTFHRACKFYGFSASGIDAIEISDILEAYRKVS